ncbi:polysaccharide biosynthesis tyrosine autokinase [Deinococcus sp. QL22]|uniref:polysaccharide biosynthesis tyrosine autokinase n=1 Tax=Deinococcus sp. QL22 TaxID=2939437 RepID=UPI002018202D|nr:polysaccharide biosynthesis tyrosine autokinase [Deinococcus sp. QL22]UQN09568.1 AAA family ATPase [Deinococcus sp. QL22]
MTEQEIDLSALWRGIQRRLFWILGTALLLALGVYFWSRAQAPVYVASATLISANSATSDPVFSGATVKAPPLPEGAVQQALQSTQVIVPLITAFSTQEGVSAEEKSRITQNLNLELSEQRLKTVTLVSRIDQFSGGNGIYTLNAKARTPEAATSLANLASQALRNWDGDRAKENIRRAAAGFRAQLGQVDEQLIEQNTLSNLERQTLIARRANLQSSLANVIILEESAVGVLSRLSDAVPPREPQSPKPLRNAVLAGLLGLLLSAGIVALITVLDRTIRNEDDLLSLNLPTLAVVPRLRQRDILLNGIVRAARQAGLYEAIGFLRVNVLTALQGKQHPILMVTSTAPGEGKSSLTATLADGFASSGQRVLIIDADLRRGTQEVVWEKFNEAGQWHQLVGTGGARSTREAFQNPENVQVLQVEENVDMLPAGPSMHDSLSLLNQADLGKALAHWRQSYDLILIDSAPLLALADSLVLGEHADAVLMICEYGRTPAQSVRAALRRAERGGLKIMGCVINKSDAREDKSYGYSYAYSARK